MLMGLRHLRILAILAAIALPAAACLWDDDTLRAEARGLPGLAEIITGRFERQPPLYYEMRMERAAREVEMGAQAWSAYDNAGVACDRLGRHDEAIEWMERKRAAMDAVGSGGELSDHQYRFLANLGTFHAHRWFARGADRTDMSDMKRGEELIAAAIELNPDAHFGRERYQLLAMRWILDPPEPRYANADSIGDLPTLFQAHPDYAAMIAEGTERLKGDLARAGLDDAVAGLSGLIALGNAWESVDVFYALAIALNDQGDAAMSYLARLRCLELIRAGGRSLHPRAPQGDELAELINVIGYQSTEEEAIDEYFAKARLAADRWHEERTRFMLGRLEAGMHPDTHAEFWDGSVEVAAVALPNGVLGMGSHRASKVLYIAGIVAGGAIIGVGVIWLMRRMRAPASPAAGT